MKIHSGLLALALLVFAALACNFNVGNLNTNTTNTTNAGNANTGVPSNTSTSNASNTSTSNNAGGVHVDELFMAKTGDGDAVTSFEAADRTVYAVAKLSEPKAGTKVTFTWYAVDVYGQPKNSKFKDVEYTTNAKEDKVMAHLTYPQDWPIGTYRVDAEINGKTDKSVTYTVE